VSPEGRFLQCIDCKLRFEFPDGAEFGTIAKQFTETCSNHLRPVVADMHEQEIWFTNQLAVVKQKFKKYLDISR
jgi:hypothetical protein